MHEQVPGLLGTAGLTGLLKKHQLLLGCSSINAQCWAGGAVPGAIRPLTCLLHFCVWVLGQRLTCLELIALWPACNTLAAGM